ncbi:PHP domain-containing protein [Lacrimispora saccharolytica]|uniref:PHP domain protein n=1 Tax=Lacrimispora saccharolytica (strain ATCC 35040 / DSM 2544 / NRCC 2533 / WM1) TaxID=610130 RepID=D9QZ42_LACSW|nr:PHP domain-containing protein [Lacrimispora saccharolytica]ADL04293.1 PHP domain protein [[Clostridium] saccharolyticum WM1]QRV21433.1 PHP domain-containing protein [Lacrimispora saccharolytica]
MKFVDLHVHSNASDGTLTPSQVVALAAENNLGAIALTDHDTIDGLSEAQAAASGLPIEIIPGIELSCVYQGEEIHILGLYVDPTDKAFVSETNTLKEIRKKRNEEMIRRFQNAGISITFDEVMAGNPDTVITRAHFARVLLEKGYVKSMDQAFKKYLDYNGPYCPRKEKISPGHAIKILTDCKASPVLAHPYQYHLGDNKTEELVRYLKELGLHGLEVYHSSNNQYESGKLKKLAGKYDLFPTGGSDFHGSNKPDISLGFGRGGLRITDLLLDDIKRIRREKGL